MPDATPATDRPLRSWCGYDAECAWETDGVDHPCDVHVLRAENERLRAAAERVVEKHDTTSIYSFREKDAAIRDLGDALRHPVVADTDAR